MGRLKELCQLGLKGLVNLKNPPKSIPCTAADCRQYLHAKLTNAKSYYRMKLTILGDQNNGRTILAALLQGKNVGSEAMTGVTVSEWKYRPGFEMTFCFNTWDFDGSDEYFATYRCFLSEYTIYLVFFNLKESPLLSQPQ